MLRHCLVLFAMLCMSAGAQAPGEVRVALVIGNAAYPDGPLANSARDARDVGAKLRALGFDVIELVDARREQMAGAIATAKASLEGRQGVGLFYYAGHGLQLDWRNYLVPIDARLRTTADIPRQTIDVASVIDAFRAAGNRVNIVVLDACRDNPFGSISSGKGLAQPDQAPSGTFVAYATAPGNVAQDGPAQGGNGLYTQYLLQELATPKSRIEDIFKRVRLSVRKQSQGRQIPWESTSLEDDFYFDPGHSAALAPAADRTLQTAYAAEKFDWDRIKDSSSADDFFGFLQKYPNGNVAEVAQARLDRIATPQIATQPDRDGTVQKPTASRFRSGDAFEFVFTDPVSGTVKYRSKAIVEAIEDGVARYSDVFGPNTRGASTLAGAVLEDSAGRYDPPYPLMPGGEYIVGKRWSGRSDVVTPQGRKTTVDYEAKVLAKERIVMPAGSFDTFKLQFSFVQGTGLWWKSIYWAVPDMGFAVRMTVEFGNSKSSKPLSSFSRELISLKLGPG
ncbi:MAG TPA: caspase family protein [Burkholderiaceae bacterium]|nr:caspase family protein [Burkholderiaceae bacterium]